MGKVLKIIGGITLAAMAFIPGVNIAIGAGAGGLFGLGASTWATLGALGATIALSGISEVLFAPKIPKSQLSRLNVSLDPSTPRKAAFGTTALNADLRYHEASGTEQEYIDYIIATSAHKVKSIDQIWFDDKLAWTVGGGVTGTYLNYLTVETRTEGTAGNTIAINGGVKWGTTRRLTGCSYVYLRIRRSGIDDKVDSPLVSGLPSRITIKGEGALLYDPRLDSTVPGGSGSHRANDQSTWGTYTSPEDCENPALQLLWFLLGWKINGVLSIGCGVPVERLDLESFITAANICDEPVTLRLGGTQRRYQTAGTVTDSDSRIEIINTFLGCMNGTLRDSGGRLTVNVLKNDLADYALRFDEGDILGEFQWNQTRGLTDSFNVVRGRYVDPSDNSLYQMIDYPEVRIDSPDGIDRVLSLDLPFVEDGNRAQRIAKQFLQRSQYKGTFSAVFTAKALGCKVGDIVLLTFSPLGWDNKPFRVISQQINASCQVPLELVEENAAIYAWDNDERPLVQPTAPTVYDPLNNPFILGVTSAQTTADSKITTFYDTATPTALTVGDLWYNTSTLIMKRWNGSAWVDTATSGAPSGTTVAGRDAAIISDTIKSDGVINTNKVNNAAIVNNSVTDVTASYTSGTINAVANTFVTAQSATITANGAPININATLLQKIQIYGGALDEIRITRNGTAIFTAQLPAYPSAFGDIHGGLWSFTIYDNPSPGSTTYILEFKQSTNGANVISNRQLSLLQVKK